MVEEELKERRAMGQLYPSGVSPSVVVQLHVVEEVLRYAATSQVSLVSWRIWTGLFPDLVDFAVWKMTLSENQLASVHLDIDGLIDYRDHLMGKQQEDSPQWKEDHGVEDEEKGTAEGVGGWSEEAGSEGGGWWLLGFQGRGPKAAEEAPEKDAAGLTVNKHTREPLGAILTRGWMEDGETVGRRVTEDPGEMAADLAEHHQDLFQDQGKGISEEEEEEAQLSDWVQHFRLRVPEGPVKLDATRREARVQAKLRRKSCPGGRWD